MTEKRYGTPRAREGQLKLQYGSVEGNEDHVIAWRGDIANSDRALLHHLISANEYSFLHKTWGKSFLEELEDRNYDVTTLKISVEKKNASHSNNKRYGSPRARSGQMKLQYGRIDGFNDHVIVWKGDIPRCDRALLFNLISSSSYHPASNKWSISFLDELEKREYDIRTLRITVELNKN